MPQLAAIAPAIMAATAVVGTVAQVGAGIIGARAQRKAGQQEAAAAEYEAQQLDRAAREALAGGQRESMEVARETGILRGRQRAYAAASGGGTGGSVEYLEGEVERLGRYRRRLALYGGIERSKGLRAQAKARRMAGRAALDGSRLAAIGTVLGGLAGGAESFYAAFGGQGQPNGGGGSIWDDLGTGAPPGGGITGGYPDRYAY